MVGFTVRCAVQTRTVIAVECHEVIIICVRPLYIVARVCFIQNVEHVRCLSKALPALVFEHPCVNSTACSHVIVVAVNESLELQSTDTQCTSYLELQLQGVILTSWIRKKHTAI